MGALDRPEGGQNDANQVLANDRRATRAGTALKADQLLPTVQTRNTGGTTDAGNRSDHRKADCHGQRPNTVSPDAALSAATQRRGQDGNSRHRSANAASLTKPFEVLGGMARPCSFNRQRNNWPVQASAPKSGAAEAPDRFAGKGAAVRIRELRSRTRSLQTLATTTARRRSPGKQTAGRIPLIGALEAGAKRDAVGQQ